MTKVLKAPLPGQAVEHFRITHGGALPGELHHCPFCGMDEASYAKEEGRRFVSCLHCGARTIATTTEAGCRTLWNARANRSGDISGDSDA